MTNSDEAIREIAEMYLRDEIKIDKISPIQYEGMMRAFEKLISEHYYPKEKYDELLQQMDELKEALISMMWQFAYYGTKNNVAVMHTGGLSALEDAFVAIGLSNPITVADFEAAIKNTDTK